MSVENLAEFLQNLEITSTGSQSNSTIKQENPFSIKSEKSILSSLSEISSEISNNQSILSMPNEQFKPEYLKCVPTFDGNPNDLNRYLATCDSLIQAFYDTNNPTKFENIYLINCLIGKLEGTAKVVVNIQNVSTWDDLKNTLQRNFADQRDETCLNRDLVMLRQQPNENPNQFYDRVLHLLNLLCSYVDNHEHTSTAKALKRNLYSELALKTFLSGLKEPLGTNIRCMRPLTLAEALQFVNQEYNNQYFQNTSKLPKQPLQNFNIRPNPRPSFFTHTTNDFFRKNNNFPSQPINIQPRPNFQPQRFFTNSQVFGKPQMQNVFRPNQNKNLPKPTPMSVSTRHTTNNFKNNTTMPNTANAAGNNFIPRQNNYFQSTQPRNFVSEELYNTEVEQYNENFDEFYGNFEPYQSELFQNRNFDYSPQYQNFVLENTETEQEPAENFPNADSQETNP